MCILCQLGSVRYFRATTPDELVGTTKPIARCSESDAASHPACMHTGRVQQHAQRIWVIAEHYRYICLAGTRNLSHRELLHTI